MARQPLLLAGVLLVALAVAAPAQGAGTTQSFPLPDRADVTMAVAQVRAVRTKASPLPKRVRPPVVSVVNRASLPAGFVVAVKAVRVRSTRTRFAVGVVQVFRDRSSAKQAPPRLVVRLRGRKGVRYEFRGTPRAAQNISEELVAAAKKGKPAPVTFTPLGARAAQINVAGLIQSVVCPILNQLANGPFGRFIGPIINALRAAFGCTSAAPTYDDVAEKEKLKGASTLTVSCAPSATYDIPSGKTVNGSLTPASAGNKVVITYTPPKGAPAVVHAVLTDASGAYRDSVNVASSQRGARWDVAARFEGDDKTAPADASCSFTPR